MRYPYLLFDADDTLFSFEQANIHAFKTVCATYGFPFSMDLFHRYESHNNAAWEKLNRGLATKDQIVIERFANFLREIGSDHDPAECNRTHLRALGEVVFMMPHAQEVITKLSKTHHIFLITNAVASVQRSRLAMSPIAPYVEDAFISEDAGAAKPSREYFDYVFSRIDGITHANCIVIVDSLSSDIQGANNYSLPCCWFNPHHAPNLPGLSIDYEISDLRELIDIV